MSQSDDRNRIRILCTSDVHGKIYPYSYADGSEAMHGFARLKTLIDSLRDENTILIDNGDVLEGSPLTFYHYRNHKEEVCPVTRAMRSIGYDFINIGNHDFNFGLPALNLHIKETGAVCLTSNVVVEGVPLSKPYVIREVAGKRIALFGVTTQHVPHWEAPENIQGVTFPDAFATAWDTVNLIRKTQAADY
ncbi:MAG: metallophosphoesterase, partial [Lachnospiraceae bacterium]|nr:metallophosphoesterase [Lachnospiraceae bacterium]